MKKNESEFSRSGQIASSRPICSSSASSFILIVFSFNLGIISVDRIQCLHVIALCRLQSSFVH